MRRISCIIAGAGPDYFFRRCEMKKTIAALLALVMALSLTACSKNETKKLVGTWQ